MPVFVWIHGGAHKIGCSSQGIPLIFNGTNMINHSSIDQPVIIVTLNYRLGVLADMYLKELIEENPSQWPTAGNYMYLDMLSALRWIKNNIRDYGGNANNVSLFGQSAGGLSVVDLGAVKGSSNLYRTAISQSGLGSPGTYSSYYTMTNALNYSNSIVQHLHCENEDKQKVLLCLRNCSISQLIQTYDSRYTRPIIDDYFFPLYPPLAIQNQTYNNINLIMGNNDYEQPICFHQPLMNYSEAITFLTSSLGRKWLPFIIDYYHLKNCSSNPIANNSRCCDIVRRIIMDKIFDCDIRRLLNSFSLPYYTNKLYSYHLNCHPECPIVQYEGICRHSSELPFVFGTVSDADSGVEFNCTWNSQTRIFSDKIISHWINIATMGKPLNQWVNYDPSNPKYFHITPDEEFSSMTWNRNCSFFDEIENEGVRETFGKFLK